MDQPDRDIELQRCEPFLGPYGTEKHRTLWSRVTDLWGFFVVPIVLTLLFFAIGNFRSFTELLWGFGYMTLISTCFGGACWATYCFVTGRWIRRTDSSAGRLALHGLTLLSSVVIGAETAFFLIRSIPGIPDPDIERIDLYRVGGLVMLVVFAIEFMYARLRAHARTVELREERARRNAVRAQLEALQARTDPHFLFNSLNTVASLIEENPRLAERAVERLSGIFRYALEGSRRTEVRLIEEVEAVRGYLEVESLRLGDRLRTRIQLDSECEEYLIPPLLLQPLVENAVLHGVAPRVEGGTVEVSASRTDGELRLRVSDDGPGPGASPHTGSGTAIETLRSRLELAFGDGAQLMGSMPTDGGYTAEIVIPLALVRTASPASGSKGAA
jgi:two-component system sensor histidine kinase AlgZ